MGTEQNESVLSWFGQSLVVGRELVVTRGVKRPLEQAKESFSDEGGFCSLLLTNCNCCCYPCPKPPCRPLVDLFARSRARQSAAVCGKVSAPVHPCSLAAEGSSVSGVVATLHQSLQLSPLSAQTTIPLSIERGTGCGQCSNCAATWFGCKLCDWALSTAGVE